MDDIYSGYDLVDDLSNLENEAGFKEAVKTSYGQRRGPLVVPATRGGLGALKTGAKPPPTGVRGALGSRMGTSARVPEEGAARPITAVNAAGFTRGNRSVTFDLAGPPGARTTNSEAKLEETPEEVIKKMEREIMDLIDDSSFALDSGQFKVALEKANKAVTKEKIL